MSRNRALEASTTAPGGARPRWWNRTVIGAGVTSALGDLSYETSNVILPGFLAALGIPAAALGTIEGVADAVSSFAKMGAGVVADRLGIRKSLVVVGYALTAFGQAVMALASGWWLVLLGRVVGWFGRGIRGPLRDAIVSEAITPETRGRAFGFHRAADTAGAVIGPLLGVALLSWARRVVGPEAAAGPFRIVFWLTLVPGVLSVISFALLVQDDRTAPNRTVRFWTTLRNFPPEFRRYLAAVGLFGIGDFAHTLLVLAATEILTPAYGVLRAAQIAGLLYVLRNVVQTAASYPVGALADRVGHRPVLVAGYAAGAATALLAALAFRPGVGGLGLLVATFALAGVFVAVQEALEPSMTAELVGAESRNLSYGALGSVNGIGKLVSSAGVGTLWTLVSPVAAFASAAALMIAGTLAMARVGGANPGRSP